MDIILESLLGPEGSRNEMEFHSDDESLLFSEFFDDVDLEESLSHIIMDQDSMGGDSFSQNGDSFSQNGDTYSLNPAETATIQFEPSTLLPQVQPTRRCRRCYGLIAIPNLLPKLNTMQAPTFYSFKGTNQHCETPACSCKWEPRNASRKGTKYNTKKKAKMQSSRLKIVGKKVREKLLS